VRKKGLQFWIGVACAATSFALYPAYALIVFLPISPESKIACGLAGWMLSWSLFALGTALAGKEGLRYLKDALFRRRSLTPPGS
jgi:hypothetical protein